MKKSIFIGIVLISLHIFVQAQEKKVESCVFCKMVKREVPCKIIKETKDILVIQDDNPQAPIHYLIIPKRHIVNLKACNAKDKNLLGDMLLMSEQLSKDLLSPQDYRLINNNGCAAGQTVFHMHIHFLSGNQTAVLKYW